MDTNRQTHQPRIVPEFIAPVSAPYLDRPQPQQPTVEDVNRIADELWKLGRPASEQDLWDLRAAKKEWMLEQGAPSPQQTTPAEEVITLAKGSRLAGYRKVLVTVLTMVAVGAIGVSGVAPQWTAQLLTASGIAYTALNVLQKYVQVTPQGRKEG